jgi:periplasmic protein TonB
MTALVLSWFEDEDPRELRRWALAASVVVGVHAALVGGYLKWGPQPDEIGDDSSVVAVELAPIDSVADAKQLDVAPAPEEMVEQKPTPPQPEKQPDQPKVEAPTPPEVTTADVAPPRQKPPEKVEEQRPPAPRTMAPIKGGAPRVEPSWESRLVRHLQQYKRYPSKAQSRSEQGIVLLGFSVDRNGHVLARHIVRSSGHADLDNEVMALIERAQPLPAFPPSMMQAQLSLTVPIRFSLR